jgi:nanoRNase/pAp phosphatase (c-di-AMP/oligoRNAs hydrolase)
LPGRIAFGAPTRPGRFGGLDGVVTRPDRVWSAYPPNEDGAPRYIFSTRSHTTFDCSTFCRQHGGGGHTKAAGCSVTIDPKTALSPYAVFGDLLDKYEASR